MKIINDSNQFISTEHFVFDVDDQEGICLNCKYQIEDMIINSPDGEILIAWDSDLDPYKPFPEDSCMRYPGKSDIKEIGKIMASHVAFKSMKGIVKVYCTIQRN